MSALPAPTPDDAIAELADLPMEILEAMQYRAAWIAGPAGVCARSDQLPPDDRDTSWFTWLQLGGRGSGKTRTGAEWIWERAFSNPGSRWAIVAPTQADARKTCFEGESGLLARCPPSLIASYNRQELTLTLINGSQIFGYSAQEPDRLRGPQHHGAWCDELAAWQYLDDTLDNLLMGMRLGTLPRMIVTTTPRPIKRLKQMIIDKSTRVDRVSTYANRGNLPAHFLKIILARYEGTRLGRQELMAEIVDDVAGALWTRLGLETHRVLPNKDTQKILLPDMEEMVVAVDPAVSSTPDSDETGIVVAGRGTDKRGYVVADASMVGTPSQWAKAAVLLYDEHKADKIVYEANQGGDMVAEVLRAAAISLKNEGKRNTDFVNVVAVWASRGKVTRAEPVSALYEQGRVSHVGCHAKLEDQMCEFTSDFDRKKAGYSPDRVDALVWALTGILVDQVANSGLFEFYRQEAEALRARMAGKPLPGPSGEQRGEPTWIMKPAPNVNMAFGKKGERYSVRADGLMEVKEADGKAFLSQGFRRIEEQETAS